MKKYKLFAGVVQIFVVLMIVIFFVELSGKVWFRPLEGHPFYKVKIPIRDSFAVLWRSDDIVGMIRIIMLSLSFLGGLRIGMLLLNNRDKLRALYRKRLDR